MQSSPKLHFLCVIVSKKHFENGHQKRPTLFVKLDKEKLIFTSICDLPPSPPKIGNVIYG
jgi:hypothetical protein